MKKAILILVILIFSLLYYMGVLTQREALPFSKEFFTMETPSSPGRTWDLKKRTSLSKKELDELYELKCDKGMRNAPLLSFFLIREAEQAQRRGDPRRAVEMATHSIKFSPELPQPHFELARAHWHENPFELHRILPELWLGLMAELSYYPSSLKLFYSMFYILSNAILMTFIIFGITTMVKYLPLYFYDIQKNLTQEVSRLLINGFKILILFIPFFLRLNILWAILFWLILLWGYVAKQERRLLLFFLIILVYLPFFIRSSSSFLNGESSEVILEMDRANHEEWDGGTEEKLRTWLSTHPDDSEVLFTLGLMSKTQGRYAEAEEFYQRAIQKNPEFTEAFSNLGNVYLAMKQTDLAIASYQKAIDLNPNRGAFYYNLYRAYFQETALSEKADRAIQRARQLDPKLVDDHLRMDSANMNRWVIDQDLTTKRLRARFLANVIGKEGFLFRLFMAWFEIIPSRATFLVPIIFLGFLVGMSRYSRTKRFLTRCPMCGSPTYRFYLGPPEHEFICFNCYRIYIQKEKLHPKIAEKKSLEVRQFQKQDQSIGRFVSFFFVGFGYMWGENLLKGLVFLFLFFIFILRFVYWNGVIPSSMVQLLPAFWSTIFWGGLFALFYFLVTRQIVRLKPRFETET
jgi:tetratricopeptide (TPR) repeat protein